jgi:hypothetical protein
MLRETVGRVVCKRCGTRLRIADGQTPIVTFHAVGGEPLGRVLQVGSEEIHRCEVIVRRRDRRASRWDD